MDLATSNRLAVDPLNEDDRTLMALRGLGETSVRGHEAKIFGDGDAEMQGIQGVQYDLCGAAIN